MNTKGIVRQIDNLGRFVIPKEMRKSLGVKEGDPMETILMEDCILIKPFNQDIINRDRFLATLTNVFNESLKKEHYNERILFFDKDGKRITSSHVATKYDHKLSEDVKNFLKESIDYKYDENKNLFVRVDYSNDTNDKMNVCAYIERGTCNSHENNMEKEFVITTLKTIINTYKNYMSNIL